jgi:protoporphyrin/coproporphyrin ferrochelatase
MKNKTAILLGNLGSPDSYEVNDVKRYLNEFLMDERVIDLPRWLRTIIVKGLIVPFRASKSAAKYKTIWTANGSPLIHISKVVQQKLEKAMELPVALCMRCANPTPEAALEKLAKENPELKDVIFVPLYPHYAMSSYETAVEFVTEVYERKKYSFRLRVVPPFYNHPTYIQALANSIKPHLKKPYDHILFSYHGIPERHVKKTDPTRSHCLIRENFCTKSTVAHTFCYRHQVFATTQLVANQLELSKEKFSSSFQSRLGADAWLKPFTAAQLMEFPKQGIKKLVIACPAFVSDCLETVEEIEMEGRETFIKNGGEEFTLIPCLNESDEWINTLTELIRTQMTQSESVVLTV